MLILAPGVRGGTCTKILYAIHADRISVSNVALGLTGASIVVTVADLQLVTPRAPQHVPITGIVFPTLDG